MLQQVGVILAVGVSLVGFLVAVVSNSGGEPYTIDGNKSLRLAAGAENVRIGDGCPAVLPEGAVCVSDRPILLGENNYSLTPLVETGTLGLFSHLRRLATFSENFTGVGSVPPTDTQLRVGGFHILGDPDSGTRAGFFTRSTANINGVKMSLVQSVDDPSLTGVQFHGSSKNALTFTSDNRVRLGTVSAAKIASDPDAGIYVGDDAVIEGRQIAYDDISCFASQPVGCADGDDPRLQVLSVLRFGATLHNGHAGDFASMGAFQYNKCYETDKFKHVLSNQITYPDDYVFAGGYFKMDSCQVIKMHAVDNCEDVASETLSVALGQTREGFLLRCWCSSPSEGLRKLDFVDDIKEEMDA